MSEIPKDPRGQPYERYGRIRAVPELKEEVRPWVGRRLLWRYLWTFSADESLYGDQLVGQAAYQPIEKKGQDVARPAGWPLIGWVPEGVIDFESDTGAVR